MLSGLPAVLPAAFAAAFDDLGLCCEPEEAEGVIARLAEDDAGRLHVFQACRREAGACLGTAACCGA